MMALSTAAATKNPPGMCDGQPASAACEKGILFGRGKSIQERPSNIHFRKFVNVFRENYQTALFPSERHRIVQRIVEILEHDGYSFLKPETVSSGRANEEDDRDRDHEDEDDGGAIVVHDHSSWVPASPPEVHKKVTSLFRTPSHKRTLGATGKQPQPQGLLPAVPPVVPPVVPTAPETRLRASPSAAANTAALAHRLLRKHLASPPPQRSRRPLWSGGTRSIALVEGSDDGPVPISSCSLYPTATRDAFGNDDDDASNDASNDEDEAEGSIHNSKTIGYTQQQVGNLTILRPIVLLRGFGG